MRESQLSSLLTPILERYALELEEIDVLPAGKRRLVRVVVDGDGPAGRGPLLDDIAEATKAISSALDSTDLVGNGPYTLEVSTRGLGRPLTAPRQWRRNRGRLVAVDLRDGSSVTGRISSSDSESVDLDVAGSTRRLQYEDVATAIVQVEFNRPGPAEDGADETSEEEV